MRKLTFADYFWAEPPERSDPGGANFRRSPPGLPLSVPAYLRVPHTPRLPITACHTPTCCIYRP